MMQGVLNFVDDWLLQIIIGALGGFLVVLVKKDISFRAFVMSIFSGGILAPFSASLMQAYKFGPESINVACLILGMVSVRLINGIDTGFDGVWASFLGGVKEIVARWANGDRNAGNQ
jgi:uncharacterized membrane protein YeaQ/YmgE (transglycosylase-associated protein family)